MCLDQLCGSSLFFFFFFAKTIHSLTKENKIIHVQSLQTGGGIAEKLQLKLKEFRATALANELDTPLASLLTQQKLQLLKYHYKWRSSSMPIASQFICLCTIILINLTFYRYNSNFIYFQQITSKPTFPIRVVLTQKSLS